jgi:AcrR family transcriptional regulator
MSKATIVPELLELFRQYGYDGVSIARISEATGLGKASLYHHFPNGKEQMGKEVLDYIHEAIKKSFVEPLKSKSSPRQKLSDMAKVVDEFYESGRKGCLIEGLTLGDASELFQQAVAKSVEAWIQAIADVGVEAGLTKKIARERAENVLIAVQGGLVLSRSLNNCASFKRVAKAIPDMVLSGKLY